MMQPSPSVTRNAGRPTLRRRARLAFGIAFAVLPLSADAQGGVNGDVSRAAALFERGEYAAAKATLAHAGGAAAAYYLGRIAFHEDRPDDAVKHFERATKADDRNADYHAWLGVALGLQAREAGKFRQAMLGSRAKAAFERAATLDPRNVIAREGLVQFYSIAPAIAGGSLRRAREHADALTRVNPMRGRIATGAILERDKNVVGAEREYLAASMIAPDSAAPYMALGALFQRVGQWDRAFTSYEQALALPAIEYPERLSAYYQFGRVGALSGQRLTDAERSLKRWMERASPETSPRRVARTRARLGMIYARQGRQDLARAEFEAALALNPRDADAREGLRTLR